MSNSDSAWIAWRLNPGEVLLERWAGLQRPMGQQQDRVIRVMQGPRFLLARGTLFGLKTLTGRMSGTGTFTWRDGRKCSPAGFVGSYTKTGNGFVKLWFWQQELVLIRYVGSYQHDKKAMAIAC